MKRYLYWGVASLALAVLAYFLFFRKTASAPDANALPPVNTPPPPPPPGSTDTPAPALRESEEPAASAIRNRILQIQSDAGSMANVRAGIGFQNAVLQGTVYPAAWQEYFGNLLNIPTPDDANFSESLAMIGRTKPFEELKNESNFDQAKIRWATVAALPYGLNLMPSNLLELIAAGKFGTPGRRDSDRSERWNAWSVDAKRIASNLQTLLPQVQNAVRMRAISELTAAGWKISGYNA